MARSTFMGRYSQKKYFMTMLIKILNDICVTDQAGFHAGIHSFSKY